MVNNLDPMETNSPGSKLQVKIVPFKGDLTTKSSIMMSVAFKIDSNLSTSKAACSTVPDVGPSLKEIKIGLGN